MDKFCITFENETRLKEVWQAEWSKGTVFLPTNEPLKNETYFDLILKVESLDLEGHLPARVIQILDGGTPESTGMVVEFLEFSAYQDELSECINHLNSETPCGSLDFSHYASSKTAAKSQKPAADVDQSRQSRVLRKIQKKKKEIKDLEHESMGKGEKLYIQANICEEQGDLAGALTQVKLALLHDPGNPRYKEKLAALQEQCPEERESKEAKKFDAVLDARASFKGKKVDWTDDDG